MTELEVVVVDDALQVEASMFDGVPAPAGFDTPLTTDEAERLTEQIRSTADVLWVLLHRAHSGQAWKALGYSNFATYVADEFDMSRSRAYQLLDQAKVVHAIEAALPEGASVKISEAQARDLKHVLEDVVPAVKEATAGVVDEDEASEIAANVIEKHRREVIANRQDGHDDDLDGHDGYSGGGGNGNGGGYGNGGGGGFGNDGGYDDEVGFDAPDLPDAGKIASEVRSGLIAAMDVYTGLSALAGDHEVEVVLDNLTGERVAQVRDFLPRVQEWVDTFVPAFHDRYPAPADMEDSSTDTID